VVVGRGILRLGASLLCGTAALLAAETLGVWLATAPRGTRWLLDVALDVSLLTIVLAVLAVFPALVMLVPRRSRMHGLVLLGWAPVHIGLFMAIGGARNRHGWLSALQL
jgi:hypothetical protein